MSQGEISGMEMRPKCVVDRDALAAGSWVWPNRKISFIGGDSPNAGDSTPGYLASLHFDQTSVSRDHTGRSRASAIPRASGHSLVLRLELLGRFYSGGKLWAAESSAPPRSHLLRLSGPPGDCGVPGDSGPCCCSRACSGMQSS